MLPGAHLHPLPLLAFPAASGQGCLRLSPEGARPGIPGSTSRRGGDTSEGSFALGNT